MKNHLILLTLLLFAGISLCAQDLPEIVYLKNGNLIRGRITKIVPNEFLTIKSGDGKLYTYLMSEVINIEKNPSSESYLDYSPTNQYTLSKGFRAFFDLGYSLNTRKFVNMKSSELNRIEISVSLGNQFNDLLYLGVGAGYNYFYDSLGGCYPVYINPRFNFSNNTNIGYLIDFKIGYAFGEEAMRGLYTFSGFGLRFARPSGGGLNLILGFTNHYVDGVIAKDSYTWEKSKVNLGAITFKLGADF